MTATAGQWLLRKVHILELIKKPFLYHKLIKFVTNRKLMICLTFPLVANTFRQQIQCTHQICSINLKQIWIKHKFEAVNNPYQQPTNENTTPGIFHLLMFLFPRTSTIITDKNLMWKYYAYAPKQNFTVHVPNKTHQLVNFLLCVCLRFWNSNTGCTYLLSKIIIIAFIRRIQRLCRHQYYLNLSSVK